MTKDPIVAQVRKVRDAYAAQFNHDLGAIYEDLKKWEQQTGHKYDLPPKQKKTLIRPIYVER
ncbi:MAG: hypothetical protein HQM09_20775 [Candidatus Riflebacteria bacterium]|nr:hypothetical protein [Candidatus Riflebacteria bacterium]